MRLNIFESAPDGFLDSPPEKMCEVLPGPSLIRFRGEEDPPLFVATLLHGNETTGIQAIRKLVKKYQAEGARLPRSLDLFVGNIEAAKSNVRRFSSQPDYNRIWRGGHLPEHRLADQVKSFVQQSGVFASVDIHNTSGKNPHYACFNRLQGPFVNLARLFSQILVYFTRPREVLSNAFSEFCPSITIEAGQPGDPYGVQHVYDFLEKCLHLKQISSTVNHKENLYVYHTLARIHVPEKSRIGFNGNHPDRDFSFIENLDLQNFTELPEDSLLGWRFNANLELSVINEKDQQVGGDYIQYVDHEIRLKRAVVPSMFTTNEQIVHQDCLGYLMERYTLPIGTDG